MQLTATLTCKNQHVSWSIIFLIYLLTSFTLTIQAQSIRYVRPSATGKGDGSSWDNASGDLQGMINSSGTQQVWLAAGLYKPTYIPRQIATFVMKNGVSIYGGFVGGETELSQRPVVNPVSGRPSSTTISGDQILTVFTNYELDSTAVLDGVVVGNSKLGMSNVRSNPTLLNCLFADNIDRMNEGGGIRNFLSNPSLTNCLFANNLSGGYGGGVTNIASNPFLTNCQFRDNSSQIGGGMLNESSSSPRLFRCSFQTNKASHQGGGVYNVKSTPLLVNCSFQNNSASSDGGGIYNGLGSNSRLINCSFQNNSAYIGGGIANSGSTLSMANSILFNNGGVNTIYNDGMVTATYSLFDSSVKGYVSNPTNFTTVTSPFASTSSTQLSPCTQAINAGSNEIYANADALDLMGNVRVVGGIIDMGAYEFQGTYIQPLTIAQQPTSYSDVVAGAPVSASVIVNGDSPVYQWYKDNRPVAGQTTATLTLNNSQLTDTGNYSVVITNTCNSLTSTAFALLVTQYPTTRVTAITRLDPSPTTLSSVRYAVTFSKDIAGLSTKNFNLIGGGDGAMLTSVSGEGNSYTVTLTTTKGNTDILQLYLANSINVSPIIVNVPYYKSERYTIDRTPPNVFAVRDNIAGASAGGITSASKILITVIFSKAVTGFSASSVSTQNALISDVSGSGSIYSFVLMPINSGLVTFQIPAGVLQDQIGNLNRESSLYSFKYQPASPGSFTITGIQITDCTLDDPANSKRYRVSLLPIYTGKDVSQPVTFSVANELSPTTQMGPHILYLWGDKQVITLIAKQPSSAEVRYDYHWQSDCPAISKSNQPPTTLPVPPSSFTITGGKVTDCVLDDSANSRRYRVSLLPQYANQDNSQPISFSIANELSPTNQAGPYTVYLWGDNQAVTLVAKQSNSSEVRYLYRWQSDCPVTKARKSVEDTTGENLQVRLLGNPIIDQKIKVEIRGVVNQIVELRLLDMIGNLIGKAAIEPTSEIEQVEMTVRPNWGGFLLLHVSTATQLKLLKVIQLR